MFWFKRYSTLLLPVAFIFLLNSCAAYRMADSSMDEALQRGGDVVVVYWGNAEYELFEPKVVNDKLEGFMFKKPGSSGESNAEGEKAEFSPYENLSYPDNAEIAVPPRGNTTYQTVHVFVSPSYKLVNNLGFVGPLVVAIPISEISKVQVRELDAGVTFVKTIGGMVLMVGVVGLIYAATKDSCPFIYVQNGDEFILVGEIYSGAIHPPLERHDYMSLPLSGEGPCVLKITNEVLEIQHTNFTKLLVFDHVPGQRVLVDRHGKALRIIEPLSPATAETFAGKNIQSLVLDDDGVFFLEGQKNENEDVNGMDGMILTFDRPDNTDHMKLVINARNSQWMDHVLGVLFERMGDMFKVWQEAQKTGSAEAMNNWSLDQGLPLAVSVKTPSGWQYVDYFDLPGPIAARDAAMIIDLAGVEGDQVQIKLECGYRFWEIDSVRADFSVDDQPTGTTVLLENATTGDGLDVTANLLVEDDQYLHQPDVGDEAILQFILPYLVPGMERSVILHSKGHYDILRRPEGKPDPAFVASFQKPGRVTEYSRNLYQTLSTQGGE